MMRRAVDILKRRLDRFRREERGAVLVEFAIAIVFLLLLFFGLMDFSRLAYHYVNANRAIASAARIAAVRPPACTGVPTINTRGPVANNEVPPRFGTQCSAGANVCSSIATVSCSGSAANATSAEIWQVVRPTLPVDATIANLRFTYSYDPELGFLGGPYSPMVTVELQDAQFEFISPLAAFVNLAGGVADASLGANIALPGMSASVPAEDLAAGPGS
ncbi:MAG: TadE/TadG family type IV pilus assembly protein [Pseudooceanicola sp.]